MRTRTWALAMIVAFELTLPSTVCFAEPKIGNAVTINNQVEAVTAEGSQPLATGSELYSNELVRTGGGQSMAQLLFLDNTNLSVGPLATVRLDKFVYDPNGSSGSVVLSVARGGIRFITGLQDSKNYTINTPYANIGVRGTEFNLLLISDKVLIQLIRGELIVKTIAGKVFDHKRTDIVLIVDSKGNISQSGIVNHPIVDFADLGPPVTNYAGLYPPAGGNPYVIVGGLAAVGGIVAVLLRPASP
jgi:hypothetical protein